MEAVVALIAAGAVLLLLETILPGWIAGMIGIGCLIAGVVLGYTHFGFATGNFILAGVIAMLIVGAACWIKYFPTSGVAKRFVSERTIGDVGLDQRELIGQTGVAHSHLRPSGTAVINGRRVDVVTEGALIERGTPVQVVAVEGIRVVVRAIEQV